MSENSETTPRQQKNLVDKDARLRILKEKQNEEKQRKLEELRAQAFAAQKFKEQKEQERRQRLEEMRIKEDIRRQQVEERKRAINDAEKDRLESIIRRNQQREIRLEARKRNERSSLVFAFGSSTPRNLDPSDLSGSFWGQRRATSTQNITVCSNNFTRRCTERDVDNGGKKRASSAGGIDRAGGEGSLPTTPAGCASGYLGRRRTDLMPTIPSKDSALRKSFNQSPASSRPSSSMSHQSTTSSVSVRHRPSSGARKPRPASIAITGVTVFDKKTTVEPQKPPLPKKKSTTTKTNEKIAKNNQCENSPKQIPPTSSNEKKMNGDESLKKPDVLPTSELPLFEQTEQPSENDHSNSVECRTNRLIEGDDNTKIVKSENSEMTASQIKAKIQTEEEAKAALAERRRLAKEEAARRAEQERIRIEAEHQAELERQRQEEEQVRQLIEAQRVAEEQRLNEAINEAKKREEEEQQRKEEDARLKALKEESDKKARLEAEKQKAEQQERLMKEEKEREARRKRVEAIMLRTRGKQNSNNQQNSEESDISSKMNGKTEEQNGSSKEEIVDNIIQEDQIENANSISTDSMNNLWQSTTQQYGNFVLNNNT